MAPAEIEPLVVVGAGFAGLATAHAARERGVEALVLERAAHAGGAWNSMPPAMPCISTRTHDRFPDGTRPPGSSEHATAGQVAEAIEVFADRHRFRTRYGVEVRAARCERDGLTLETTEGEMHTRRLVVATGEFARPRIPDLEGEFEGPVTHSSGFRLDKVTAGERVLVVGAGNSGAEIALEVAARGIEVSLASRTALGSPKGLPAVPGLETLLWWMSAMPVSWLPGRGGCTDLTPLQGSALDDAVRAGRIRIVSAVTGYQRSGARLEGGETLRADRIVLATGFLRETQWLGDLVTVDARGTPRHDRGLSTEVPGLGFVGLPCMRTRRSGFLRGFSDDAASVVRRLVAA